MMNGTDCQIWRGHGRRAEAREHEIRMETGEKRRYAGWQKMM